jgi:hypothetical protein
VFAERESSVEASGEESLVRIIGISGLAGVGKDTAADFLVREYGFVKIGLADPLKRICRDVFAFTDEQLWGPSELRNAPDRRYPREHLETLSPREALQQLGTEWGRNMYPNVWVDYLLRTVKEIEDGAWYDAKTGAEKSCDCCPSTYRGVVIPDLRFPNELAAIKKADGVSWRIARPTSNSAEFRKHVSETSLDGSMFDRILINDGSLEELYAKIEKEMT